jgi:hypothetical protein
VCDGKQIFIMQLQMTTRTLFFLFVFIFLLPFHGRAQWSLTSLGLPMIEDFQTYRGGGFVSSPAAGQLDSDDWRIAGLSDGSGTFGGTHASGDFARGTSIGGETTGGSYGLNRSGNWAFMVQPADSDWTPGTLTLRLVNNTGNTINQLDISFLVGALNDQNRANEMTFSWSTDDISYTSIASLDYVSPEVSTSTTDGPYSRSTSLTGLSWVDGSQFYLRWESDDVSGSGSRDELFLDDISVTPFGSTTPCITPSDQATGLTFGSITTTQIDGSFTTAASSPDGYVVVAYPSTGSAAAPVDGTVYAPGDPLGVAGVVVAFGSSTTFSHTGLNPGVEYTFEVYAYNNLSCTGGPAYNTASPLSGSAYTLPEAVTDLNVGCTDGTSLELSWTAPAGSYNASYTGNILYGWTGIGWESNPGYASTAGSTVPDGLNCFTTDVSGVSNPSKVKYVGTTAATTQRGWLSRFNDPTNWLGYADNTQYNSLGPDYWGSGSTFTITGTGFAEGVWDGTANNNWFDCNNWNDLTVPDATVNVSVSTLASFDMVVDPTASFSDDYGDVAQANDVEVDVRSLELTGSGAALEVYGNLRIAGSGSVIFDPAQATELTLFGDWDNDRDETAVRKGAVRCASPEAQLWI